MKKDSKKKKSKKSDKKLHISDVIGSENVIDKQAQHFISSFGDYALEVITKTRNGALWHPSQEDLFQKVEEMLQNK
jgi:hypothetical protein